MMGFIRRKSASVLALRVIPVVICLGCLTSLAADNLSVCAGAFACRWPAPDELLPQAAPAVAEAWINNLAAGDGFTVEGVQHYEPGQDPPAGTVGNH